MAKTPISSKARSVLDRWPALATGELAAGKSAAEPASIMAAALTLANMAIRASSKSGDEPNPSQLTDAEILAEAAFAGLDDQDLLGLGSVAINAITIAIAALASAAATPVAAELVLVASRTLAAYKTASTIDVALHSPVAYDSLLYRALAQLPPSDRSQLLLSLRTMTASAAEDAGRAAAGLTDVVVDRALDAAIDQSLAGLRSMVVAGDAASSLLTDVDDMLDEAHSMRTLLVKSGSKAAAIFALGPTSRSLIRKRDVLTAATGISRSTIGAEAASMAARHIMALMVHTKLGRATAYLSDATLDLQYPAAAYSLPRGLTGAALLLLRLPAAAPSNTSASAVPSATEAIREGGAVAALVGLLRAADPKGTSSDIQQAIDSILRKSNKPEDWQYGDALVQEFVSSPLLGDVGAESTRRIARALGIADRVAKPFGIYELVNHL